MNPWGDLVQAAGRICEGQSFPRGALYMVGTPIGNMADLSVRAVHVLTLCDTLACEDTRQSQRLLQALGLHKPLLAVHQHNEAEATHAVVQRLAAGERVAYVTDAGTPGISDPGARLCAGVLAAGHVAIPIPGPSSVTTLLSVSAWKDAVNDARSQGFVFAGFLPAKGSERQQILQSWAEEPRGIVWLEAPHRMASMAQELMALGSRRLTLGRELTKHHEQVVELASDELDQWLKQHPEQAQRGEWILALHPMPAQSAAKETGTISLQAQRLMQALTKELPLKSAARITAELTPDRRNDLYTWGLKQNDTQA